MSRVIGNFASRIFQPVNAVPKNAEVKHKLLPKSQKLMLDKGLIRQSSPGVYTYLPLGLRVLNKLVSLVDKHMRHLGAQKVQLSSITEASLWRKTGRWDSQQLESFKFQDRHKKDFLLSPTHEESVTDLIASLPPLSHKHLPLLLYQISSKFRDEVKPRCGLIRSREFLMKDLYSFDASEEDARTTYDTVLQAYRKLFDDLGVNYSVALGSSGEMGGSLSHEFHYETEIGEDVINQCTNCKCYFNNQLQSDRCIQCGNTDLTQEKSIEVGHTFLLGTKYSRALSANYVTSSNSRENLVMCSFGLGLSRILAAAVERLSTQDGVRWPAPLVPYKGVIITPKDGSKEEEVCGDLHLNIYTQMAQLSHFADDLLIDDRRGLTIGRKLHDSRCMGYPFSVVIGHMACDTPALVELHLLNKTEPYYLSVAELMHHFQETHNYLEKISTGFL